MSTIFAKIIRGEIPCHKLAENERFLSFLDVRPIRPGHALVIPKQEVDYLFDMPEDLLQEILPFARPIAKAIQSVIPCARIGLAVVGLEVSHAHMHLIPINAVRDMDFGLARPAESADLAECAARIRAAL